MTRALSVIALVAVWLFATDLVALRVGGYTECDKGDCGSLYGVLRTGLNVLLVVLAALLALGALAIAWRLRNRGVRAPGSP